MGNSNKPFGKISKSGEDNFACFLVCKCSHPLIDLAACQYTLQHKRLSEGNETATEKALIEQRLEKFKKYQQRVRSIIDGTNKKMPLTGVCFGCNI